MIWSYSRETGWSVPVPRYPKGMPGEEPMVGTELFELLKAERFEEYNQGKFTFLLCTTEHGRKHVNDRERGTEKATQYMAVVWTAGEHRGQYILIQALPDLLAFIKETRP